MVSLPDSGSVTLNYIISLVSGNMTSVPPGMNGVGASLVIKIV